MAEEDTSTAKPTVKKYQVQTPIKGDPDEKPIPAGTIIKLNDNDAAELLAIDAIVAA